MRFDRHAEVSGGKSDKKHKCDAQRDAEDFSFILPSASPTEMTSAYTKTMCAIDVGEVRTDSMVAGAAQVLREGKPWTL